MTFSTNDTQHDSTLYSAIKLSGIMQLRLIYYYAKCHDAVSHYVEFRLDESHKAECHYAECHYAECRGANFPAFKSGQHEPKVITRKKHIGMALCLLDRHLLTDRHIVKRHLDNNLTFLRQRFGLQVPTSTRLCVCCQNVYRPNAF